jgi:hypothetical protein
VSRQLQLGTATTCEQPPDQLQLGPVGFHAINYPKPLRHLIFADKHLVDYDIATCGPSIFRCLGDRYNFSTTAWTTYIDHKDDFHTRLMAITGHAKPDDIKSEITALLYGSSGWCSGPTSNNSLSVPAKRALHADCFIRALKDEARVGMRTVLYQEFTPSLRKNSILVNAVQAELPYEKGGRWRRQAYAHLLTGYEQFAIRTVCRGMIGLVLIVYDGFIAAEQNVEDLERLIAVESQRELNVPLALRLKRTPLARLDTA